MMIMSCADPLAGKYRVMCFNCELVQTVSMHGDIECPQCHIKSKAHDLLVDFDRRQNISLPDGCRPNSGQCPPPGGE